MSSLRPELGALPPRIASLPVDERGYPVPWFVSWHDGKPEFRAADGQKFVRAIKERRCWVCGDRLGRHLVFVLGPMCGINRTTSEPPCHDACAVWSAMHCPFLTRPRMKRREDEALNSETRQATGAGIGIDRNPGVALVWTTEWYRVFNDGRNRPLIAIGPPTRVRWFSEGREATRGEVEHSIETGLLFLRSACDSDPRSTLAHAEITRRHEAFKALYPPMETRP